jgi:glucose/arabinose dehydrogenase
MFHTFHTFHVKRIWRRVAMTGTALLMVFPGLMNCNSNSQTPFPPSLPELKVELAASGFEQPLLVTAPPGEGAPTEGGRLFVVERTGAVRIVKGGAVLPTPFLDVSGLITSSGGEQGLLGLAFPPTYAATGYFYINYTSGDVPTLGRTVIARYTVSANPDVADGASGQIILTIDQPYENHNGGMLAFGPGDGYLYIATGDGGDANDPDGNAQDLDSLLGKLLRINVDGSGSYHIPPDNPFEGHSGVREEIWAYGLRNPWRFSFDRVTGDLYIGDVGQDAREEIDFQPASSLGAENYGWNVAEGFACTGGSGTCGTSPGFTPPILDYGREQGRSVTGGYVYRGSAIPGYAGAYFFADFISSRVWSFRVEGGSPIEITEWQVNVKDGNGRDVKRISSFGEDGFGELYLIDYSDGELFRIVSGS